MIGEIQHTSQYRTKMCICRCLISDCLGHYRQAIRYIGMVKVRSVNTQEQVDYEYLHLQLTSADGFAQLTQYNKIKTLANTTSKSYHSSKTCNIRLTCEMLSYSENLNLGGFYNPRLVIALWKTLIFTMSDDTLTGPIWRICLYVPGTAKCGIYL